MKVALVHEFLTQLGGAEKVLQAFHEIFPSAPVYTLVYDETKTRGIFSNWDIRTSSLQKLPGMPKSYKTYLPLMPCAISRFDFSEYDLVLSDSSAFAKGLIVKKPAVHICYCHTPTRYLWQDMGNYVASLSYSAGLKILAKLFLRYYLRGWDFRAAQKPDYIIANSETVKMRIKKFYGRESEIIYPPVNTEFFRPTVPKEEYFFTASRLEPYKKIDLVVDAFRKLGLPLKVAGDGTQLSSLKKNSKCNIEFLGRVPDEKLRELFSGAKAFVFPALEDAGIMVLESLSCGTPVIGLGIGGTAEFVKDGQNGVLFAEQSSLSIVSAVERFNGLSFSQNAVRKTALEYSKQKFKDKIIAFIKRKMPNVKEF